VIGPKIDHDMSRRAELGYQVGFKAKSAMIGRDTDTHGVSLPFQQGLSQPAAFTSSST
jgi:hypothetical protein